MVSHLQPNNGANPRTEQVLNVKACEMELYSFIDMLCLNCEGYTIHEAWRMFCKMKDWDDSFPNLMRLWQATMVIHYSIVACERGLSKKNGIKEIKRNRLSIAHLDDLMRVSLNGLETHDMQWDRVFEIREDGKDHKSI